MIILEMYQKFKKSIFKKKKIGSSSLSESGFLIILIKKKQTKYRLLFYKDSSFGLDLHLEKNGNTIASPFRTDYSKLCWLPNKSHLMVRS